MGDEKAEEADHFLHSAVGVIEKCAFLVNGEFVRVGFAWRDGFLADEGDAVLFDGNFESVPVHGGAFGKGVFDEDARPHDRPWVTWMVGPGQEPL